MSLQHWVGAAGERAGEQEATKLRAKVNLLKAQVQHQAQIIMQLKQSGGALQKGTEMGGQNDAFEAESDRRELLERLRYLEVENQRQVEALQSGVSAPVSGDRPGSGVAWRDKCAQLGSRLTEAEKENTLILEQQLRAEKRRKHQAEALEQENAGLKHDFVRLRAQTET